MVAVSKTKNSIPLWDRTWPSQLDILESYYVEIKTGSYTIGGTAHEKILGVPYKYQEIVKKTGKPVLILCIGAAEKFGWKYNLFNGSLNAQIHTAKPPIYSSTPNEILHFFNEVGFTYYPFSALLHENTQLGSCPTRSPVGQLPILSKPS